MAGLEFLWYLVIAFSVIAYTVLDGFDLGVGMLHPFVRTDTERRTFLNAIGPVWDGNEVWIVVVIGALFAGFPSVYATLFSSFYNLTMVLIACLIFRAAAIEFRSQKPSPRWRSLWDMVFAIASFGIAFFIGLAFGNLVQGIPLNAEGELEKALFNPWRPYPILIGVLAMALFTMHGAIFLVMKTEGELQEKLKKWTGRAIILFFIVYATTTWATWVYMPHMTERMRQSPGFLSIGVLAFLSIVNIFWEEHKRRYGRAFISSCIGIALFVALFGVGTYPMLIRSDIDSATYSLTIYNASSSALTLKILIIIAILGVPLVIAYGIWIYRIFRGKVKLGSHSY